MVPCLVHFLEEVVNTRVSRGKKDFPLGLHYGNLSQVKGVHSPQPGERGRNESPIKRIAHAFPSFQGYGSTSSYTQLD